MWHWEIRSSEESDESEHSKVLGWEDWVLYRRHLLDWQPHQDYSAPVSWWRHFVNIIALSARVHLSACNDNHVEVISRFGVHNIDSKANTWKSLKTPSIPLIVCLPFFCTLLCYPFPQKSLLFVKCAFHLYLSNLTSSCSASLNIRPL